jgi:hypothetical protein
VRSATGLPDGLFSNKKSEIGLNVEGLGMENVIMLTIWNIFSVVFDKINSRRVNFVVIWYIYPVLVCSDQGKSGNPAQQYSSKFSSVKSAGKTPA